MNLSVTIVIAGKWLERWSPEATQERKPAHLSWEHTGLKLKFKILGDLELRFLLRGRQNKT